MPVSDATYTGEIAMFSFDYAPFGWAYCNGALIPVSQNQALFALLADTYGGNNSTVFGLPNLNSRSPVGRYGGGSSSGFPTLEIGQAVGSQTVTLGVPNLPAHTHVAAVAPTNGGVTDFSATLTAYETGADRSAPEAGDLLAGSDAIRFRAPGGFNEPASVNLGGVSVTQSTAGYHVTVNETGDGIPFGIQSPVLAVNFSICMEGLFPART
ncbi:MAG: tail fiber protein [Thalassobaculaceae bacterium]|nr:tail fiber protein [Thalassobaculaceae bacterium]